jgi:Flp pilus assembly protein TadG
MTIRAGRFVCLAKDEEGSETIEFAICLSVLMTFVFALMELCLVYYSYDMISECAREGTRYAMVRGSTCTTSASGSCAVTTAQITTYVNGLGFPNPGGGSMVVTSSFPVSTPSPSNLPGNPVVVKITYSFPIRMPLIPKKAINLSAQSQMTIVQ